MDTGPLASGSFWGPFYSRRSTGKQLNAAASFFTEKRRSKLGTVVLVGTLALPVKSVKSSRALFESYTLGHVGSTLLI